MILMKNDYDMLTSNYVDPIAIYADQRIVRVRNLGTRPN